jgi:hypothetical protein
LLYKLIYFYYWVYIEIRNIRVRKASPFLRASPFLSPLLGRAPKMRSLRATITQPLHINRGNEGHVGSVALVAGIATETGSLVLFPPLFRFTARLFFEDQGGDSDDAKIIQSYL